jgi:hypothetical protein
MRAQRPAISDRARPRRLTGLPNRRAGRGDSVLTPTSTIMMQHNCGFWDAVNRAAS